MEYTIVRENRKRLVYVKLKKIRDIGFDLDVIYSFLLSETVKNCDEDLIYKVIELTDSEVKQRGI